MCLRKMAQAPVNVGLRKFDMKKIPQDAVAIFIGRRRTGKSTLVRFFSKLGSQYVSHMPNT